MEHRAAASLLIFLIDGWQGRCVEMTPLERPERSRKIGVGISCICLTGRCVDVVSACVVHICIVATSVIPGRMAVRFPAVDEHTIPG